MRKIINVLIFLALSACVQAQMSSHLKEEFHDQEAYGIQIVERLSGLRSAVMNEDTRVICLQAFGEEMNEESSKELLDWVREGHTVWFYDARLAPHFGMRPTFFESTRFRNKPESGQLGGKKYSGVATVAVSLGTHPVQTGVGQVTVFLPSIEGEDKGDEVEHGGIELVGDTEALLQFTLDSPALVACRREGRGLIVFKSLLWTLPLSGERFQSNLLEFSAGYQVPGPAGVGKVGSPPGPEAEYVEGQPAEPVVASQPSDAVVETVPATNPEKLSAKGSKPGPWVLELKDGTILQGELETEMMEFETGTSSLKLKPEELESLEFGSSVKLDRITAKGREQSGLLLTSPIRFRTDRGVEEFEKEDLQKLSRAGGTTENK
jgi:hypothetical protein